LRRHYRHDCWAGDLGLLRTILEEGEN
jgi:hypothetical protein